MNNGKNKRFKFFLIFLSVIFFNFFIVNSIDVQVKINESSSLTKLLTGQYSLIAQGTIEIYNPSNFSQVYEFNIPLTMDALVGITRIDIDNTSNKFDFKFDQIHGYFIKANETIRTSYKIFGLLNYNIYTQTKAKDISVFEYYSAPFEFSSNVDLFLQKPQREGFEFNLNGTLNKRPLSNETTARLISTGIKNPTDFSFFSKEIKVFKTTVADPFFRNGQVIKIVNNQTVAPLSSQLIDLFDTNSSDDSVYWVSSNFVLDYILNSTYLTDYKEDKVSGNSNPPSSSSWGTFSNNSNKHFYDSILLKKSTDKSVIKNGDEVKVFLRIVNVNNFEINDMIIYDFIPKGYEIKDVSSSVQISSGKLTFKVNSVEAYGTKIISYTLLNKNELTGITYLKPAELIFRNDSIFSDGVLLINDLLPEKKIFIQKEITYIDEDYARVTIKVRNLGSIIVEDILISDNLGENSSIREISKMFFTRGSWRIKTLKPGEEWQVSYLISRNVDLQTLPNVFGIDKTKVFGNLVSSEQIITLFKEPPKTIEKIGMTFAVGLLVFYLLF